MNTLPVPRPLVIAILDGWGISPEATGNAIMAADTPAMDLFANHYPLATIQAAGIEVGLPWGEVGNSETGHSNIGAGQVHYQMLPLIDQAIINNSFFKNEVINATIAHAVKHNSNLHLIGLLGPGGVHAHSNHLYALLKLISKSGAQNKTYIHIFTDGRDSPPQSALTYLKQLEDIIGKYGTGRIASVTGRLYGMDRNENWQRTQATYEMLTGGPRGAGASSASAAIAQAYDQGITDENILPTAITKGGGPIADIVANDAVFFFNFRPDRARQLTRVFVENPFVAFKRTLPTNIYFASMARYDANIPCPAAFIDEPLENPLAKILSAAGLKQLHIAETEKYAHITYYLNGGHEKPFPGEQHTLIKSSSTKNFAEIPAMESVAITDAVIAGAASGEYDVIFVNYANADMVGHTGNLAAAIQAVSFTDAALMRLYEAIVLKGGALLITADHGNAESMVQLQTGEVLTDHTSNPVPLHYVFEQLRRSAARSEAEKEAIFSAPIGVLADVGPTILDIMHINRPDSMTGISLLGSMQ